MSNSYAITVQLGAFTVPILTLAFAGDGSFSVQDRISVGGPDSLYQILQIPFTVDQVGMGKRITFDSTTHYTRNKPKLSHHAQSGMFQVSSALGKDGHKIISGFDETGSPKGLGNYSLHLERSTNDGGPIVAGMFWGLNRMPAGPIRSSVPIGFLESHLRDQTMNNRGSRSAVAVDLFHFLKDNNPLEYMDAQWARYTYRHYKRPLLTRVIDPGAGHDYLVGVSCLLMRCDETSQYGYRLGGGPGRVNPQTNSCLNTHIMFEMPSASLPAGAINIDYVE